MAKFEDTALAAAPLEWETPLSGTALAQFERAAPLAVFPAYRFQHSSVLGRASSPPASVSRSVAGYPQRPCDVLVPAALVGRGLSPVTTRVRDAMVPDPKVLPATATAQEAAELLVRPEVRAVLVVDGERLLGLVTAPGLVERVVAAGRDPKETPLREIVEGAILTVEPDTPLDDAYRLMEDEDVERLPVTEDGRLVGVLSRSGLQRRLAEDEEPAREEGALEV